MVALTVVTMQAAAASEPYATDGVLGKIRRSGVMTLAHREAAVPFSYYDARRKPIGYAIDLCLRIAEATRIALGLQRFELRYLPVDASTRIDAIVSGRADLECGSTTNNEERRKQVAFTIPHYIAGVRMLTRRGSGVVSLEGLREKAVVTTVGTTSVGILRARNTQATLGLQVIEAARDVDSFALVAKGGAEAFVMDDVLLYSLRARSGRPDDFQVVGQFLSIEPLAIMLRRDDPAFKSLVDRTMKTMITSGQIQRIYDKWFGSPIPPSAMNLNLPMNYLLRDSFRFPSDQVAD